MKKKILAALFLCVLSLAGCNSNQTNNGNNGVNEVQTAYDQLTADEKLVFDALKMNLSNFYDQSSVRVVAAGTLRNGYAVDLKIQAKNKLGGTITKIYTLYYKNHTHTFSDGGELSYNAGYMYEPSSVVQQYFKEEKDVSVQRLNAALKEYFEDMGLL